MAYCPKCQGEMEARDTVCPHCGYDFPSEPADVKRREGLAYSPLADVALMVGGIAAGFASAASAIGSVASVFQGQLFAGLVVCPLYFFISLAMLVVILRVQRL